MPTRKKATHALIDEIRVGSYGNILPVFHVPGATASVSGNGFGQWIAWCTQPDTIRTQTPWSPARPSASRGSVRRNRTGVPCGDAQVWSL